MRLVESFFNVTSKEKNKIRQFYNKTEDDVQKDLEILLEWLNKTPHLPKPFDVDFVESFLLRNKFQIEKTKIKIDKYYTCKGIYPKFFENMDVHCDAIKNNIKAMIWIPLPNQLPTLERVTYFRFLDKDASIYNVDDSISYMLILLEIMLMFDYSISDRILCDFDGVTLKHVAKMNPITFASAFQIYQEGYSGRVSFVEIINLPPTMDVLINLFKRILPLKLFQRLRIHKTIDSLYEVFPKEYLPKEYGGNQQSVFELYEKFCKQLTYCNDYLLENSKKVSNEKLRTEKLLYNDIFGVDGTFKTINLD